jgi:hypothetical protein
MKSTSGGLTAAMLDTAIMATVNHPTIGERIKSQWIRSNMMYDAIVAMALISPHLEFKASSFNRLFSKSQIFRNCERFDGSNMSGIFKVIYSKKHIYFSTCGKRRSAKNLAVEKPRTSLRKTYYLS